MPRTFRLLGSALVLLALLACREDPLPQCTELLAAEKYEEAAVRCEQLFEETQDPRARAAAADAHHALGRLHYGNGESALAAADFERALAFRRDGGDHAGAAKSLYGLFYLAWDQGEYRRALTFADAAAEEASTAGDPELQETALSGVFTIRYEIGDLEGARKAAEAARELASPDDQAYIYSFLGTLRLDQGRPALARDALEKVLKLATGEEDRRFFRSTHLNLVRASLELGELERADHHLAEAWKQAEPEGREESALLSFQAQIEQRRGRYAEAVETLRTALGQDPHDDWRWELESQMGLAEEARGDREAALDAYRRAADVVERMRAELGSDELKPWLLEKRRRPFEALFELLTEAGRNEEALAAVERAKARTFLDAFIHATSEASAPEAAGERMDALSLLLPTVRESPVVATRPIGEVLDAALGRHVLVYFRARDALWQIVVAGGRIVPRRLAGSVEEIEKLARRFAADPDDATAATALAEVLLPAPSLPERGTTLYVAVDHPLDRVSFAALRHGGRFLVEDYEIVYVPGLNALAGLENRRPEAAGPAVVLGDPRRDLPAAAREAAEVASRLGAKARTGSEATREALAAAAGARVLHLATHTGFGPGGPWLALAGGELGAREVIDERLSPELVVLASCAAAQRRGLGMWGSMGAAFLAAGSEGVLAALSSVEDEPTRRFVLRFYDQGGDRDPAGALARTQRAAVADGEAPSFWAPFVLLGAGK